MNVLYCYSHGQGPCLDEISNFLQQEIQHLVQYDFLVCLWIHFIQNECNESYNICKQSTPRSSQSLCPTGAWRIFLSLFLNHTNNIFIHLVHTLILFFFLDENFFFFFSYSFVVMEHDLLADVQTFCFVCLEQLRLRQFFCINLRIRIVVEWADYRPN